MFKALCSSLVLCSLCGVASPVMAQAEAPSKGLAGEVAELEAMLGQIDGALKLLQPLVERRLRFAEYDVRHLLYEVADQRAPRLRIPSPAAGRRTSPGGALAYFEEDGDDGPLVDVDRLVDMVESVVGAEGWEHGERVEFHRGQLFVVQTELGHARVLRLLDELRAAAVRSVQYEVGFYALTAKLERAVVASAQVNRGVLDPGLLARLDESVASGEIELVESAVLTAMNQQRIYLHQGREQTYVETFERLSGGTGAVLEKVSDPVIRVLRTGMALDLRGSVVRLGERGSAVALDVRFLRASPLEFKARATPWGTIDIPRVESDAVRSSARVPSGSGMLVFSASSRPRRQGASGSELTIIVRPRVLGS